MDDTPLTRESLNGQAYARLCRDLKAGRFAPGEKLKLRDLAKEMGISPTPAREALARLISEQALEQVGHHSVRVPVLDETRLREVRDLRMNLEGEAAARAALCATPADIAELESIHERMVERREAGDEAAAQLQSEAFHMGVYRLAHMPVLLRMVEGLWLQCGPLMKVLGGEAMGRSRKQHPHLTVLRGLRRADAALARQGIHDEVARTIEPVIEHLRTTNAAPPGPVRRARSARAPA